MKPIKYPKIGKIDDLIEDYYRRKHKGYATTSVAVFTGSCKLHGTNASVRYTVDTNEVSIQSRNIWMPLYSNGHKGFCDFIAEQEGSWRAFAIKEGRRIAEESNAVVKEILIFGEWCGPRIQGHVAISQLSTKIFVLFEVHALLEDGTIYETCRFDSPDIDNVYHVNEFKTVELEIDFENYGLQMDKVNALTEECGKVCPAAQSFGIVGLGEGWVWKSEASPGHIIRFKTKTELFKTVDGPVSPSVQYESLDGPVAEFCLQSVTAERINQGFEFLEEAGFAADVRATGQFVGFICNDIFTEEANTIATLDTDERRLKKRISKLAAAIYKERISG